MHEDNFTVHVSSKFFQGQSNDCLNLHKVACLKRDEAAVSELRFMSFKSSVIHLQNTRKVV